MPIRPLIEGYMWKGRKSGGGSKCKNQKGVLNVSVTVNTRPQTVIQFMMFVGGVVTTTELACVTILGRTHWCAQTARQRAMANMQVMERPTEDAQSS